jgi:hypothetical protein
MFPPWLSASGHQLSATGDQRMTSRFILIVMLAGA